MIGANTQSPSEFRAFLFEHQEIKMAAKLAGLCVEYLLANGIKPTVQAIQNLMNCTRKTVLAALKELDRLGIIYAKSRPRSGTEVDIPQVNYGNNTQKLGKKETELCNNSSDLRKKETQTGAKNKQSKIPYNKIISRRDIPYKQTNSVNIPPTPQRGDGQNFWNAAFGNDIDKDIVYQNGELKLLNGERAKWLEDFGSEKDLDLALMKAARRIREHSTKPKLSQVREVLADIILKRRDQDRRYRDAVKNNQKTQQKEKHLYGWDGVERG